MLGINNSEIDYRFGDRIAKRRKECGFKSQTDLAEKMVPAFEDGDEHARAVESRRKLVSNWESGKSHPSLRDFVDLCKLLDCDMEYLLGDIEVPRKEIKSAMDITGLSAEAINALSCLSDSNYVNVLSALIEDANFEYLMYLIGKRFEYSLPQSRVQPIVKMEQGKYHLKNAKAYHESLSKNEVDIHIDGGHLIAQKKNLLDSLINSALVDRMHEMAMNYEQIKGVNHRG